MPLTEERRRQLEALVAGQTTASPEQAVNNGAMPSSSTYAPSGLELQGITLGKTPSVRFGPPKTKGTASNPDARRIVAQAKAARAQIAQIWDEADKLIPATEQSGYRAIPFGLANKINAAVGGNEPARAFRQTIKAKLRNVARSLGERGVITDKDIEDFVASMPDFTDSTVSRPIKKSNLLNGVDALVNAFTESKYGTSFYPEAQQPLAPDEDAIVKRLLGR